MEWNKTELASIVVACAIMSKVCPFAGEQRLAAKIEDLDLVQDPLINPQRARSV